MRNAAIIIPCHLPWKWPADFVPQTAKELSKKNFVICYLSVEYITLKSLLKLRPLYGLFEFESEDLWLYHPVFILPFERFMFIKKVNHWLNLVVLQLMMRIRYMDRKKWIFWVFDSSQEMLTHALFWSVLVLYDCVDYVWAPNEDVRQKHQAQEKRLIQRADVMVVNSHTLYEVHHDKRPDVTVVPLGFRHINKTTSKKIFPKDKPVIGYVGVIDYRIDFFLLYELTSGHPMWRFVLWGPIHKVVPAGHPPIDRWVEKVLSLPNVLYGESKPSEDIGQVISQFSVCMIPYDTSLDIVRYSFPMKIFEYFYAGKPTIATSIHELRRFPQLVFIASTPQAWGSEIARLLKRRWKNHRHHQRSLSIKNNWTNKIIAIYSVLEKYVKSV